ncbi:hypothetical protein L0Y59_00095, partial [Candidatus Uhrbacteria bacterium]|nr:hypothetical protein [Candidatus Uhrbacteria bacterium]
MKHFRTLLHALAITALALPFQFQTSYAGAPVSAVGFALDGAYTEPGGQPTGTGSFSNGSLGAYLEGSCIPMLVSIENKSNDPGSESVTISFDYKPNGNPTDAVGIEGFEELTTSLTGSQLPNSSNLNEFTFTKNDLSGVTSFPTSDDGTVSATVAGPYGGGTAGAIPVADDDTERHYDIELTDIPGKTTAYVLFCARLGLDAGDWPGASLHVNPDQGGGSIQVTVSDLIELPSLTITKVVSNGDALPEDFSFNVSPSIDGQSTFSIPTGGSSVVIDNIPVDGSYVVTESAGPDGYSFEAGSGTNCSFVDEEATATVAAGATPTDAVCEFTNTDTSVPPTTGTLVVTKTVVNDDGGTAVAGDFTLDVTEGALGTPQSIAGNASGTSVTLEPGSYAVTEQPDGTYVATFSDDCVGTIAAGETKYCTVTNDDVEPTLATTGTLIVVKKVVNDDRGEKVKAKDFDLTVSIEYASGATSTQTFAGDENGTTFILEEGTYDVTEDPYEGYTGYFSEDCSGKLAAGDTKTCTVTNREDEMTHATGTLRVVKVVTGGTVSADAFTFDLDYVDTSGMEASTSFAASENGVEM